MSTDNTISDWITTARGRDIYKADYLAECWKDEIAVKAILAAPSHPALLKAYHSFMRSLYGSRYNPSVIQIKPWDMLNCSSGVMKAKSARCRTLTRLETAVFTETGLPRKAGNDRFRGGTGINFDLVKIEPGAWFLNGGWFLSAPLTIAKRYGIDVTEYHWPGRKVILSANPRLPFAVFQTRSGWIFQDDNDKSHGKERRGVGWIGFDTPEQAVENFLTKLSVAFFDSAAQTAPVC